MTRSSWSTGVVLLGMLTGVLSGQSPRGAHSGHVGPSKRDAPAQAAGAVELRNALEVQQRSLAGGDPVQIEQASKRLYAIALRQLAETQVIEGQSAGAVALYRRSLELVPSTAGHLELAAALLRVGDTAAAAEEALTATEMDPTDAAAWAVRGGALRSAKREKDAVVALEQSLRLKPSANVAYALGSTLLALHEKSKADAIFAGILKASGDAPIWYVEVGDAYREADYRNDAVRMFREAIRRDPEVAHAEFFLGLTYLQMNEWGPNSASFEHLRAAVRIAPRDYVSNFYLGALESTDGSDLASSDRHLRAAADIDGRQPEVWLYLGLNANRQHRTAEAKADLEKSIDLTGKEESRNNYQVRRAYFALGRLLMAEGDRTRGGALLERYRRAEQAAVSESATTIQSKAGTPDGGAEDPAALAALHPGAMSAGDPALAGLAPSANTQEASLAEAPGRPALDPETIKAVALREKALRHLLASSGNDLGTAEAREQQYGTALSTFAEAVQWETPPQPALLRNEGAAAFREGRYEEAARALEQYFAEAAGGGHGKPAEVTDDRAHMMLAMSTFSLGQFPRAAQAFDVIPAATKADARASYAWAFALAHVGRAQEAVALARDLMARSLPIDQRMLVCHVFVDAEDYEDSAACYRGAYAQDPTVRLAHYEVGEALVRLDRATEALPELRAELQLSPGDPNVEYGLAFALLQSSQTAEAQHLLEEIAAAHPEQAGAQYQLGKLLLEKGDVQAAVSHLELAERGGPAPTEVPDYVHYQLGTAYRRAGRVADSDRELALYREIKERKRAGATERDSPNR